MSISNRSPVVAEQSPTVKRSYPTHNVDGVRVEQSQDSQMLTVAAARSLAVLRISMGFVFLWAFFDKAFGFNYATPSVRAWINGGSPTKGFLSSVEVGPLQSTFNSIAGSWWADLIFMVGLLGIGVALTLGIALRIAAVSVVVMMAGMWLAEFPIAQFTSKGTSNGSSNPFMDSHAVYALVLITLALCYAGNTWGLGKLWARMPFVSNHTWAR